MTAQPPGSPPPPPPLGGPPGGMPPNNHLVWAVFSFLGCFPLGLIAILNSMKVSNLWALGQYDAARAASASARKFALWATIAWAVVWGGFFLFWVVIVVIGASQGTSTS